jgi:uncharacterized protein (DUF58 family)
MNEARSPAQYLRPEVIRQISRLDLKARFIVEGFISGLHGSPFHGFSVEFSEHRKYEPGDPLQTVDWALYGRTDRYYVKKFQAETNMDVTLVVDASPSMDFRSGEMTKFDYAVGIAAALAYLAVRQNDPVGLVTFSDGVHLHLPPRCKKSHLLAILSRLARLKPSGQTDLAGSLHAVAELVKRRGMVIVFSDFMDDVEKIVPALHHLAFRRHDIILFHVLDHAELELNFDDLSSFRDLETGQRMLVDPGVVRRRYREALQEHIDGLKRRAAEAKIDYLMLDTSTPYDKALTAFLMARQ